MEAIYDRQKSLNLKEVKVASIVGCGGTGFWTAYLLAMSGVEHLILVDADRVDETNLNRLPLSKRHIGVPKVEAVYDMVKRIRPNTFIETYQRKIETEEDCSILSGVIFACTDNLKSQRLLWAYAKKNGLKYQRVGYDGTVLCVTKAFPLSFDEQSENEAGYQITPSWVIPAVLASAFGVMNVMYKETAIMDDIAKLGIITSSYIPKHLLRELKDRYYDEGYEDGREEILDNIHDYIPDGYGYCEDCEYQYTESEMETARNESYDEGYDDGRDEGYNEGYNDAVEKIKNGKLPDGLTLEDLKELINSLEKEEVENE
ncbi:MAG: ThiF family adenylyltransferase [Thermodesulfobacterium sp.]|nr:ThiF family adenylyltransferase [Thermodesulfobacterium sp.]